MDTESADPNSMHTLYRRLLNLRAARPSLSSGEQRLLNLPTGLLGYLRTNNREHTAVLLNFSSETQNVDLADGVPTAATARWTVLLSTAGHPSGSPVHIEPGTIAMQPLEAVAFDISEWPSRT